MCELSTCESLQMIVECLKDVGQNSLANKIQKMSKQSEGPEHPNSDKEEETTFSNNTRKQSLPQEQKGHLKTDSKDNKDSDAENERFIPEACDIEDTNPPW